MSYDVLFAPSDHEDFSRPAPSSAEEAVTNEALQADFSTIEAFFVHFHDGIVARVEEAITR